MVALSMFPCCAYWWDDDELSVDSVSVKYACNHIDKD